MVPDAAPCPNAPARRPPSWAWPTIAVGPCSSRLRAARASSIDGGSSWSTVHFPGCRTTTSAGSTDGRSAGPRRAREALGRRAFDRASRHWRPPCRRRSRASRCVRARPCPRRWKSASPTTEHRTWLTRSCTAMRWRGQPRLAAGRSTGTTRAACCPKPRPPSVAGPSRISSREPERPSGRPGGTITGSPWRRPSRPVLGAGDSAVDRSRFHSAGARLQGTAMDGDRSLGRAHRWHRSSGASRTVGCPRRAHGGDSPIPIDAKRHGHGPWHRTTPSRRSADSARSSSP